MEANLRSAYVVFHIFFLPLNSMPSCSPACLSTSAQLVCTSKSHHLPLFFYHLLLFCYLQPFCASSLFCYQPNHLLKALLWYEKKKKKVFVIPWGPLSSAGEGLGSCTDWDCFPQGLVLAHVLQPWLIFPLRSLATL